MRPLDLNFASRPFRNNTLLWTVVGVLLVGLLAFTAWNAHAWWTNREDLRTLRADLDNLGSRMGGYAEREARADAAIDALDLDILASQASKANEVIGWKAFSWTQLFNRLEDRLPFNVKLTMIRPNFRVDRGSPGGFGGVDVDEGAVQIRLDGIAKDATDFLALQRSFICGEHFDGVEPIREVRTANGQLLFEMSFLYYPEGTTRDPVCPPAVPENGPPSTLWEWDERKKGRRG